MRRCDRRTFLQLLSAAGGTLAFRGAERPPRAGAVRVDAEATVFYAQPDGQRVLVRFFVAGADAPGGRLRVFDRAGKLAGTAGVIPLGDGRLYGELWLPLTGPERMESDLVLPGRPSFRSVHALAPLPRWMLYWTTVVSPDELTERLRGLSPLHRGTQVGLWASSGVTINPVPAELATRLVDHLPFLRLAEPARDLERELGLPRNPVAVVPAAALDNPTLALALHGSGIRYAATWATGEPQWLTGPDGSRVILAPLHPGARPTELGFQLGGAEVLRRVERWLAGLPAPAANEGTVLIAGTREEDATPDVIRTVTEWNSRLAFPRIMLGSAGEYFRLLERRGPIRAAREPGAPAEVVPSRASGLTSLARARAEERERRARAMAETLGGLDAAAAQLAFAVPGTLVFNPSPFTRTGLVRLTDGTERVVTDVPAVGYAYVPHQQDDRGRWRTAEDDGHNTHVLENAHVRLALDPESGAIRSLVSLPDGTEWARPGGPGLNGVPAARMERITRLELRGAAKRLVAERWSPGRGAVRSVITLYDALPFVDIENTAEAVGDAPPEYQFSLPLDDAWIEWEVPAGARRARAPAGPFAALRWIRVSGPPGSVLLSSADSPFASITSSGELTIPGPRGVARFSVALRPAASYPPGDDAWRFGWNGEPYLTALVTGRGAAQLPSFGSLLEYHEPGITILGIEPRGADRVLVYLQEVLGIGRRLSLRGGLLRFAEARLADLLGRPGEPIALDGSRSAVTVSLPAHGVVAVSLHGVTLHRA